MTQRPLRVAELLVADTAIPADVRLALSEGRDEEAGQLLMELFNLSCDEAKALVTRTRCYSAS